jgi:transcriptional regulator with XRE-family HTH domain
MPRLKKETTLRRELLRKELATRLLLIREALGMTQGEIGKPSGLVHHHLSRIENGELRPPHQFIQSLGKDFKVNLNYLYSGDGPMFKKDENR